MQGRLHLGLVDELTLPGALAVVQRGQQGGRQESRRDGVGIGVEGTARRAVVPSRDLEEAADRSGVVPVTGQPGRRPGLAEQAGGGHDDPRVEARVRSRSRDRGRFIVPAVNESRAMSHQASRRRATAWPSGCLRLSCSDNFEVLKDAKNWQRLIPGTSSLNGPTRRSRSGGLSLSTCTTVAPWSASALAVIGPTPIHEKSATLMPSSGRRPPPGRD